jgi:enamine deaminase RidA (YjgF/YER057c/UK114 family)
MILGDVDNRLAGLGIELPEPPKALASYAPWVRTGNLVFVSGQITARNGRVEFIGRVGHNFSIEEGIEAARLCALNIVAQLRDACGGDLDRVTRIVKLTGFVNASPDFQMLPAVINGASDLLVEIFGDKGRHARSAVGAALPFNVAVEIEAIAEIA